MRIPSFKIRKKTNNNKMFKKNLKFEEYFWTTKTLLFYVEFKDLNFQMNRKDVKTFYFSFYI